MQARPDIGSDEDETNAWSHIMFLEAAVLVGYREAACLLLRRFLGTEIIPASHMARTLPTCKAGGRGLSRIWTP